jgi:hypothetical protein
MEDFAISESILFDMPKYVYLQVKGVEKPIRLKGDKVESEKRTGSSVSTRLIVKLDDNKIGEFEDSSVSGWWVQDDES